MQRNDKLKPLIKTNANVNDANVAQNIARVLALKVKQQQKQPFQLF